MTTTTRYELPDPVHRLVRNLRDEVKEHKRLAQEHKRKYGDAVREMKSLRREAAKHRVERNEALAELAALRAESV